jgi:hypothetical protein
LPERAGRPASESLSLTSARRMGPTELSVKEQHVQINKDDVLQLLRDKGQSDQVSQAQQELPDQVDTDQHADLLGKFGLAPKELLGKFGGGLHL